MICLVHVGTDRATQRGRFPRRTWNCSPLTVPARWSSARGISAGSKQGGTGPRRTGQCSVRICGDRAAQRKAGLGAPPLSTSAKTFPRTRNPPGLGDLVRKSGPAPAPARRASSPCVLRGTGTGPTPKVIHSFFWKPGETHAHICMGAVGRGPVGSGATGGGELGGGGRAGSGSMGRAHGRAGDGGSYRLRCGDGSVLGCGGGGDPVHGARAVGRYRYGARRG